MDDAIFHISSFLSGRDKIHFLLAVRPNCLRWAAVDINNLTYYNFCHIDRNLFERLFKYMTPETVGKALHSYDASNYNYPRNLPLPFIQRVVEKFELELKLNTIDGLDWSNISQQITLSKNFIRKYSEKLNWYSASKFAPPHLFLKHVSSLRCAREIRRKWEILSEHNTLTPRFVNRHRNTINWASLCENITFKASRTWWRNHLKMCKYFIFNSNAFAHDQLFLEECVRTQFDSLLVAYLDRERCAEFNCLQELRITLRNMQHIPPSLKPVRDFLGFVFFDYDDLEPYAPIRAYFETMSDLRITTSPFPMFFKLYLSFERHRRYAEECDYSSG